MFLGGKTKLPQRSVTNKKAYSSFLTSKKVYSSSLKDAENTDPDIQDLPSRRTRSRNDKSSRFNDALNSLKERRSKSRPSYLDSSSDESLETDVQPKGKAALISESDSDLEEAPSFIKSGQSAKPPGQTTTASKNSNSKSGQSGEGSHVLPDINIKKKPLESGAKSLNLSFPLLSDTDDEEIDSLRISNKTKFDKVDKTKNLPATSSLRRKKSSAISATTNYAADTSDEDYLTADSDLVRPKKKVKTCTVSKRNSKRNQTNAKDKDSEFVPWMSDSSSTDIGEEEFDEFLSTIRNEKHSKRSSSSSRVKKSPVSLPSSDIDEAEFFDSFLSNDRKKSKTKPKKLQVLSPSSDLDETEFFDEFLSPERERKKKTVYSTNLKKSQAVSSTSTASSSSKVPSDTEIDIVETIPSTKTNSSTRSKKSQVATSTVTRSNSPVPMDIEDEINILESISTKKPKPKRAKKAKDIQFPGGQSANESNRQSSIVNFLHSTPGATSDDARSSKSTPRSFRAPRRSQGEDDYFLSYFI